MATAQNFLVVHPWPHFTIDAANVEMVPLGVPSLRFFLGKLHSPLNEVGGNDFIVAGPTVNTWPLVVNQLAFLPAFSYSSRKP